MEILLKLLTELKPGVNYREETDLVAKGILDSLTIIELVPILEEEFEIQISMEHFTPDNFDSAKAIMNLVNRLKG